MLGYEVIGFEFGLFDRASIAVDEFDRHVVAVLGKEADGSFASLDTLVDVPDGSALLDKVSTALLCQLILGAFLLRLYHLFEFIEGEIVFSRILVLLLHLFVVVFFVLAHIVHFFGFLHDAVAIHVVHLLLLHVLEPWDWLHLGLGASFCSRFFADDLFGVLHHRQRVLSKVIRVVGIQTLVVLVVLPLGMGRIDRKNIGSRSNGSFFLRKIRQIFGLPCLCLVTSVTNSNLRN